MTVKGSLSLTEAATSLGVAPSTLSHQAAAGRLRVKRYGRAVFVTLREVERYRVEQLGTRAQRCPQCGRIPTPGQVSHEHRMPGQTGT